MVWNIALRIVFRFFFRESEAEIIGLWIIDNLAGIFPHAGGS
jgi:hypothetical protein